MNLILFALLIHGCSYTLSATSDTDNGSPLMWLLVRQLERTNDDFKKLEGQIQGIKTNVDSNRKYLEGLRNDMDKAKSQIDRKISYDSLEPINKSLQKFQIQNDKRSKIVEKIEGQIKSTNLKVDILGKHVTGMDSTLKSVKLQSGNNKKRFKAIDTKLSLLENSVEHLRNFLECQTGWKQWKGHCYYFSSNTLNWAESKRHCKEQGSHLVKVETLQENSMVVNEVRNIVGKLYWIGANDVAREGTWVWESDGTAVSYSSWLPNEPNDYRGNEDCAYFHSGDWRWNDNPCHRKQNFICEKELST